MNEEPEEDEVEDTTTTLPEGPPAPSSEESEKRLYKCSICKAIGVPIPIETPTGTRYKCPKCKKFMRPLSPEEETPPEEEDKGPLPPTEVILMDRVQDFLKENLPRVYGIPKGTASKTIEAILDTMSPAVVTDPYYLHTHIKNFAPNVNDRHLESIITKMFWELKSEGYLPEDDVSYRPSYEFRRGMPKRYGVQYPLHHYKRGGSRADYPDYPYPAEEYYGEEDMHITKKPPRTSTMKIVIDGQEIETDFDGYMAYKRFQSELKKDEHEAREHELRMKKLEAEIMKVTKETGTQTTKEETRVKVTVGGESIEVPASLAPLYLKQDGKKDDEMLKEVKELREEVHKKELELIQKDLADLKDRPGFLEQLDAFQKMAPMLGFHTGAKTTLEVVENLGKDIHTTAQSMMNRLPGVGGEFKPEVTRTVEERRQAAEVLENKLAKSEELMEAENELIKAAARVTR